MQPTVSFAIFRFRYYTTIQPSTEIFWVFWHDYIHLEAVKDPIVCGTCLVMTLQDQYSMKTIRKYHFVWHSSFKSNFSLLRFYLFQKRVLFFLSFELLHCGDSTKGLNCMHIYIPPFPHSAHDTIDQLSYTNQTLRQDEHLFKYLSDVQLTCFMPHSSHRRLSSWI